MSTKQFHLGVHSLIPKPMKKLMGVVVFCFINLLLVFMVFQHTTPHVVADRVLNFTPLTVSGQEYDSLESQLKHNNLLFSSGFKHNDKSCLSRYQSLLYTKKSTFKPSPYLNSRLRKYEDLHKCCQRYTQSYNRTIRKLESGHLIDEPSDCNYLIWLPVGRLGNRILSLASAFFYALLTNRVLLVSDNGGGIADLFCDPFPGATWLLPQDFPIKIKRLDNLNQKSPECYSNILKLSENSLPISVTSSFVYLNLVHGYDDYDKLFFCDQDQIYLQNVSWVIMRSHYYFIPSLFLMPSFEQELATLFPQKETVFHFLGRYLFFPSNPIWELITRYYQAYLAQSDEKIGIQIRTDTRLLSLFFNATKFTFQAVLDTILSCSLDNNILPEINSNDPFIILPRNAKSISVLITSLTSGFDGKIRDIYWEHSTVNGDVLRVFQPSAEREQKKGNKTHDRKAWVEIFLLSLTDKLITSPLSTFGYVAQGLGGLKPWILHKPENGTATNPPCTRAISVEPCFQTPPCNVCKTRYAHVFDLDSGVPHFRHCEDTSLGLKLVVPKGNDDV